MLGFAQLLSKSIGNGREDERRRHVAHVERASWQRLGHAVRDNRDGGSGSVSVPSDGAGWTLRVADTGAGLSQAQLQHRFEPFSRFGRTTAGSEGVGLGLVLVHRRVERAGPAVGAQRRGPGLGLWPRVAWRALTQRKPTR